MTAFVVWQLGYTGLVFIDPKVKVNEIYYRDMPLSHFLLTMSWRVIFQQHSAPAQRARKTINFLESETPACVFFQICGRWTPRPQRNRGCTKCWQICTIRSSDTPVSDYCCFLTLIFHKVVCWHAVRLMYIFFQIYYRVCRWKNFEIRLTVSDGKSSVYLSDSRCSVNEMDLYNSLMFYTESWLFNQINSYNVHAIITLRLLS